MPPQPRPTHDHEPTTAPPQHDAEQPLSLHEAAVTGPTPDAMWRVKSRQYPQVKQGDALALQRSVGNKAVRQLLGARQVQRHSISPGRQGVGEEDDELQRTPDVQRHSISPGRQGVGEEDDELQRAPDVQRQPAFGRPTARPRLNPWGHNGGDFRLQRKGEGAKAGAPPPVPAAAKGTGDKATGDAAGAKGADPAEEAAAQKEYEAFVAGGPYKVSNYVPDTTGGGWGKFDATYAPAPKVLSIDMRIKFNFPDDQHKDDPSKSIIDNALDAVTVKMRQQSYINSFISQVTTGWGGRYQFQTVRPPQAVWGKLNPVSVKLNVTAVESNPHYTMDAYQKKTGTANVSDNTSSQVELFKGDNAPSAAFNPGTGTEELARVQKNLPKIRFGVNSAAVDPKYLADLQFVADYLRQINTPKFQLDVIGFANKTGDPAQNMKLSQSRAETVAAKLKGFGLTNHGVTPAGQGDTAATADGAWRKVEIVPSLPKGFTNMQDVTLHEFGHMLGLDDEYQYTDNTGKITDTRKLSTHHDLVSKMYGKKFADLTNTIGNADSASVMYAGDDVRSYHYVTMWKTLYDLTAAAPAPKPPLGWQDWKIIG